MTGAGVPATGDAADTAEIVDLLDAGAFLARVVRLDPSALVRLRAVGSGQVELWAWLPRSVLVSRLVDGRLGDSAGGRSPGAGPVGDVTVGAADLLQRLDASREHGDTSVALPTRRDTAWRGALPGQGPVTVLDTVPAAVVERLVAAGEAAFRDAARSTPGADPQTVGESLLDHESLHVSAGGTSVALPLGLLLGVARMGFLGADGLTVAVVGGWVRVEARFGTAYRRRDDVSTPLLLSPR
ncbi:MAG TPA: hypothetical protein VGR21_03455 [Cryptosporangiaceae bacterium]|nr:hypothetical protein [Cryptosporangiaceae bacterium]